MATAKDWLRKRREEKEAERVANSMSKENLLSAVGSLHERRNKDTVGYKSLSDTWKDLYKRATDYYNNEAYKGYADAYNGMVGNERYVGKNDAGRWYRDLEKQKNTANEGVDELLRELDQYSRYYNEDAVNYVRDLITQRQKSYDDVMTAAGKFRDHWSQWETEDDYNNAVWESDFYSKLQSGDFDGAVKMHQEKLDALKLSPTEEGMAKLSEYGEYLAAAKIMP